MVKNIKKSLKYFIIFTGIIILVPGTIYLLLQNSNVQTFLINKVAKHFSNDLKSTISVGHLEFKFFNRLIINDLLIKDNNNDTLFYSEKLTSGIKRINFRKKSFRFGRVILLKPFVAFVTDSTGQTNLNPFLGKLRDPSDTIKKAGATIFIDQIDVSDARFSLINHSAEKKDIRIDFNNLNLNKINGIIEDFKIFNDTTKFNIYNLSFRESSGFHVDRMRSTFLIAKQDIFMNSVSLNCDSSILNITKLSLRPDSSSSFKNFIDEVNLNVQFEKSLINTSDLSYFIPSITGYNESIWLSGRIFGTISELRGRDIEIWYRDKTFLDCDFDFSGLPEIDNTFIYIGVNSLKTNAEDFEKIIIPGKGSIVIPDILQKLGNLYFDGSFTGFTTDFVTYGKLRTSQGNVSTDISFRPEEKNKYRIKGLLTGSNINLGEMTGKGELFGKLSAETNIDGYAYSLDKFEGNITGRVDSVEINNYIYRNINLNGYFTEKTWDGSIKIEDENIKMDLLGLFNFKGKLPEFDFTLNLAEANLFKLNFDKLDSTSSVTLLLTSNFKGNSIDNLDGEIKVLNSSFTKFNNNLELYDLSIRTFIDNNEPVLSLRTDFVDADIKGHYNFGEITNLLKSELSLLMPSKFSPPPVNNKPKDNNFTFQINFKNTDKINNFLRTGLLFSDKSYLYGTVFPDSIISVQGKVKMLSIKNNILNDFELNAKIIGSDLTLGIKTSSLILLRQSEQKGFSIDLSTKPDNFIFTVSWDNKEQILNRGNFIAKGSIARSAKNTEKTIINIVIDSSEVYSQDNRWKISNSSIMIDTTAIVINKMSVSSNDRYYLINGAVSENPADTLHLEFKGIDISPLNYLITKKKDADQGMISLDFKGLLSGKVLLANVYKNLLLESNISVSNFSLLGSNLGTLSVISALDIDKKLVDIKAENTNNFIKTLDISGFYDPEMKKINLTAEAAKLPIDILNSLLKVFASGISGTASGKVNFSGVPGDFVLNGSLFAENASIKIDYLQTRYKLNDSVRFDEKGFKFNNIRLLDERGNTATLNGAVYHKNFKNFAADITVNLNPNECLILNTKPKDNDLFYGTAYATGVTSIKSGTNSLSFDISAKTGKNTKVYFPLNNGLSVSEYSFITFTDPNATKDSSIVKKDNIAVVPVKTGIDLNFDLEITPDAEVQLIFDSKVGDVMKGHGSGDLNINLNRKGEFKIFGDYIIEDGDYLFTLGNILNKSFSVENGGRIIFNGDLDNAEIDINAIYKLRTSLDAIVGGETNERVPVECQLKLTGKLFNPVVGFDIYLPNADEKTRAYVKNYTSTEEELSRQFLYLLVMNSFYTESSSLSSGSSTVSTGTSAMAVTTTEMLTNQLSNWLSQISNDFDVGFTYRPGTRDINSQDVQLALSTQLLNDKVLLNSNFDVRGINSQSENTAQLTGDFDAEIKITNRIHFKVFNRYNDPFYTGKTAPYTQGLGIFFKQDFNKFSDLFRKKVKSDMKKEEKVTPEAN